MLVRKLKGNREIFLDINGDYMREAQMKFGLHLLWYIEITAFDMQPSKKYWGLLSGIRLLGNKKTDCISVIDF